MGVAPLAVFFDASDTKTPATARPFHEVEYRWDFGDPRSGNWTAGARPKASSRNAGLGPVAAHVFDPAPGSGTQNYNVTLTAFDGTNTSSCSVRITVTDPNAVFSGTNTTCVSASGNFTGCPDGANQVISPIFDTTVNAAIGSSKRILFRRGDVFTTTAVGARITVAGPGLIGAYGSGAPPSIKFSANNSSAICVTCAGAPRDWRFMDLDMDANGFPATNAVTGDGYLNAKSQLTFLRLTTTRIGSGVVMDLGTPAPDQIAVVDCSFLYTTGQSIFVWATRYSEMGNLFQGGASPGIINQSRHMGLSRAVISNNTFRGVTATGGSALTIRTHTVPATDPQPGKTVIANNAIDIGNNVFAISVFASVPGDLQIKDIIIDGNYITVNSPNQSPQGVSLSGVDTATVRNNLITIGGIATFAPTAIVLQPGASGERALNNAIYNNSIYSSHTAAGNLIFLTGSAVNSPVVQNNVGYAPNQSSVSMIFDNGSVTPTLSNNSSNVQVKTVAPAGWAIPPVTANDWRPTGGYLVGGGAAVPVWSDIFLKPRRSHDLGAVAR